MKWIYAVLVVLTSLQLKAQPCQLLTQTFAVADTIKVAEKELYKFRFSENQLTQLLSFPGLKEPIEAVQQLQRTLDQDNESFRKQVWWQLDGKLAEKYLEELKRLCPQTSFGVYARELGYYKAYFKPKL